MTTPDESTVMIFQDDPPPNREPEREPMAAMDYLYLATLFVAALAVFGGVAAGILWVMG
jgi:hypothetical protein